MFYLNRKNCKLIAHRGYSGIAPENTLPAFELAVKHRFDGIECDVQTTKDGTFIVFHDDTLDRMTGVKGNVKDFPYDIIKDLLIINGRNYLHYRNLKIPLLEEYLQVCAKGGLIPVIEIKRVNEMADLDRFVEIIKAHDLYEQAIVISFNPDYLVYLRTHYPDLQMQIVVKQINQKVLDYCQLHRIDVDCYFRKLSLKDIEKCKAQGLKVNSWTVDHFSVAKKFIDAGIDYLTTNKIK